MLIVGQDVVAKRTRQSSKAQRCLQISPVAASHADLVCQPQLNLTADDHHIAVPAKRTRLSTTSRHHVIGSRPPQTGSDIGLQIARCASSVSEPVIARLTLLKLPGRFSKRTKQTASNLLLMLSVM